MKALIGDIGRCAVHDGPGIRTTVFFKGCNLRCAWCHNPEFIAPQPEILFDAARCLGCGDCAAACPENAMVSGRSGADLDRRRCTGCGVCADICPSLAITRAGQWRTEEELMEVLLRDRRFYAASGGGVTFSGGEPTLCMPFLQAVLQRLRRANIHTVLETNGDFSMAAFETTCLDHLDLIYVDLKTADAESHRAATGRPNHRIWSNLAHLERHRPGCILPRIPLVPGHTATQANIRRIARRLKQLGFTRYALLPYHPLGLSKASRLGLKPDPGLPQTPMSMETLRRWHAVFQAAAGSMPGIDGERISNQGGEACRSISITP